MNLRAVVFDVDGVLVQSMERHHEAYKRVFESIGHHIEQREVFANEGRRSREVIASLAEDRGIELDEAELERLNTEKQRIFLSFGPLPLYPGVEAMVAKLRARGFKTAAVTGTNRHNVENHFGALIDQFDVIVTADDVKRTKPDPEPYLSALERLGISADEALVVENAPLGIRSAKAAGIRVVGVTSTLPASALAGADDIVSSVTDILDLVEVSA